MQSLTTQIFCPHLKLNRGISQANDLFLLQLLCFIFTTITVLKHFHKWYWFHTINYVVLTDHCWVHSISNSSGYIVKSDLINYSANHDRLKTQQSSRMINEIFIILTSKTNLGTEPHTGPEQEKPHAKSIAPNLSPTEYSTW